jgi:short-subunit dehydrogenase
VAGQKRNRFWSGLGIAAGVAMAVTQVLRWRQFARWRKEWQEEKPGVALVTGASSGIGEAYARRLAERGFDLVLVARRKERLEAVATEIRQNSGVQVEVLPADLSDEQGIARVADRLAQDDITLLVNNAGFGIPGTFLSIPVEQIEAMIRVHVLASVRLTKAALPAMLERGWGAIVNVSSVAAFFALPGDATYGPTKAYLNQFTKSLALSLAGRGIRLQSLCPGFTLTGMHSTESYSGTDIRAAIPGFLWLKPEFVVDESLRCLEVGEVVCIPSRIYQFIALLGRTGIAQIFINLAMLLDPDLILKLRGWRNQS